MEELLSELVEFMKMASPELWRIALRQVYVNTIFCLFLLIFFIIFITFSVKKIFLWIETKEEEASHNYSDDFDIYSPILKIFIVGIDIVFVIWSIFLIYDIVQGLANPEYMAIQKLINLLPK